MNLLILTGYDRNMAELAELCLPSKRAWAERWGVELRVLRDADYPPEHGHPSFQKLRHIKAALQDFGAVFWMDADSVITNPSVNPFTCVHNVTDMGCWPFAVSGDYKRPEHDPRPWWNQWSAGHAIWFNDWRAIELLDAAMKLKEHAWSGLWDQSALQAELSQHDDKRRPQIWPTRTMNSVYPGLTGWDQADWQPGDFLCHFTGIKHEHRVKAAREFINQHLTP